MTTRAITASTISLLLLAAQTLSSGGVRAATPRGLLSQVRSHGLLVRLAVPGRQYPHDALIDVTLMVKNVSRHAISMQIGANAPSAFVLDSSGQEVFEPRDPLGADSLFYLMGPGPRFERLRKGETWFGDDYLVLRGNRIDYSVFLGKHGHSLGPEIKGRPVMVELTDEAAPHVSISTSPTLQATVTPPTPMSGPMFYFGQTSCVTPSETSSTGDGWTAESVMTVTPEFIGGSNNTPSCAERRVWHGLVGWLDHPVAAISYEDPAS